MDILSSAELTHSEVLLAIAANDAAHPGINDRLRWLLARPQYAEFFRGHDVAAAMISSCRADRLRCGRCALAKDFYREFPDVLT